jgi:hypothetical protein
MLTVEIVIIGRIDPTWVQWLGGLQISPCQTNRSLLSGQLTDQSALYGILARLRDLGLPLASVWVEAHEDHAC